MLREIWWPWLCPVPQMLFIAALLGGWVAWRLARPTRPAGAGRHRNRPAAAVMFGVDVASDGTGAVAVGVPGPDGQLRVAVVDVDDAPDPDPGPAGLGTVYRSELAGEPAAVDVDQVAIDAAVPAGPAVGRVIPCGLALQVTVDPPPERTGPLVNPRLAAHIAGRPQAPAGVA